MQTQKVTEHIVNWLKDYATKAGVKGYVIGVSGGVDSGVVSTLCAMTGLEILAMEMPIRQQKDQVNRALEHLDFLAAKFPNVKTKSVDLNEPFEALYKTFDVQDDKFPAEKLAFANTRSRLRMLTLYYYGQINGLLVCGTGNKVEDFGIGFYTKYGDGGVDLSPIADLMKSDVYALAEYLNVPNSIQNAAPTDGLFGDSRTDEDQLGASYDELEWAMLAVEKNLDTTNFTEREKEVYQIYKRLNTVNQHKMNPIPVCIIPNK